jgi:hypothetical protein
MFSIVVSVPSAGGWRQDNRSYSVRQLLSSTLKPVLRGKHKRSLRQRPFTHCSLNGPMEHKPASVSVPAKRFEELHRGLQLLVRRECQRLMTDRLNERASQAFQSRVGEQLSQLLRGSMLAGQARVTAEQFYGAISRYPSMGLDQKQSFLLGLQRFADHFDHHPAMSIAGSRARFSPEQTPVPRYARSWSAASDSSPTGIKPNLSYRAITREQLRRHPRYVALPSVETLLIESVRDLARIPQDSALWLEARRRMQVNASSAWRVLGFCEPMALEWLRDSVPFWQLRRGHEETLQAWRLAREPHLDEEFSDNVLLSMNWGKMHEQNGILTVLHYLESRAIAHGDSTGERSAFVDVQTPESRRVSSAAQGKQKQALYLFESGLHVLQPEACAGIYDLDCFAELPTIAASPDAFICRGSGAPQSSNDGIDVLGLQTADERLTHLELIEVKCPCPFVPAERAAFDTTPTDSATSDRLYRQRLVSPQRLVYANHFAQVQLQMLCTDTWRAHFISWTPDAGARLFVLERDEAWLEMALIALRDFYREFVHEPPPENFFADRETYRHLLELTVAGVQHSAEQSVTLSADEVQELLAWEAQAGLLDYSSPAFLE